MRLALTTFCIVATVLYGQCCYSQTNNYGFEQGDLTGWDVGLIVPVTASVVTAFEGVTATEGLYFAQIGTRDPFSVASLGLNHIYLYKDQTLTFDWRYLTSVQGMFAEGYLFTLNIKPTFVGTDFFYTVLLAANGTPSLYPMGDHEDSGWHSYTYVAEYEGDYRFHWFNQGLYDGTDKNVPLLDNIRFGSVAAVPEPNGLLLIGLNGVFWLARRIKTPK